MLRKNILSRDVLFHCLYNIKRIAYETTQSFFRFHPDSAVGGTCFRLRPAVFSHNVHCRLGAFLHLRGGILAIRGARQADPPPPVQPRARTIGTMPHVPGVPLGGFANRLMTEYKYQFHVIDGHK